MHYVAASPKARSHAAARVSRLPSFWKRRAARYVLRRRDGPGLADRTLRELVGCNVECDGIVISYVLIADRIQTISEPV